MTETIAFLKAHELLPAPAPETVLARWSADSFVQFLDRYLKLRLKESDILHAEAWTARPPMWVFLDPRDASNLPQILNHLLLADRVLISDPLTELHCPPRRSDQWVQQFCAAVRYIESIAHLVESGFVTLVPDPRHCGLHHGAVADAKAVFENESLRNRWLAHGHICRGQLPAKITVAGTTVDAPMYHIHFAGSLAIETAWRDTPAMAALNENPRIHIDGRGSAQKFDQQPMIDAWGDIAAAQLIQKHVGPAIATYKGSLAMAMRWGRGCYSTSNRLTHAVLEHDLEQPAVAVRSQSGWLPPARRILNVLGLDAVDPRRLLDFRDKHRDAFTRTIKAMRDACVQVQSLPGSPDFGRDVSSVMERTIDPAMAEVEQELRSADETLKKRITITSLGAAAVVASDTNLIIPTIVGGLCAIGDAAAAHTSAAEKVKRNPFYLLWKLYREKGRQ